MTTNILKLDPLSLDSVFKAVENNLLSMSDFEQRLREGVQTLLKNRSQSQLMDAFYRLDLPEYAVIKALNLSSLDAKTDCITRLILERLRQKAKTRGDGVYE